MSALAGRTALVTGAGRGIGLAITQRLLADGASVVMVDRDAAAVEGAAKRLGAGARAIVADVTRTADVNAAVTAAHDWHGRLDIVVNNAGITGRSFRRGSSPTTTGIRCWRWISPACFSSVGRP